MENGVLLVSAAALCPDEEPELEEDFDLLWAGARVEQRQRAAIKNIAVRAEDGVIDTFMDETFIIVANPL
jgi:hypothetical protein